MGKSFGILFLIFVTAVGVAYYYYFQTGYKFGLEQSFLFKNSIQVTSDDFKTGEAMPTQFTCDGEDTNPELNIRNIPQNTKSLAIILEDRDAKPTQFTHWILYNLNPETTEITSSVTLPNESVGQNDFGNTDYNGPCPPVGQTHKYAFNVYALNESVGLETLNRALLDKVIIDHTLSSGTLVGVYTRK